MTNINTNDIIMGWNRNTIASKIANDLPHSSYVNLGIGMPELVSQYIKEDREIIYHSENGLLGMGPSPNENEIDLDLINAGKKPVTILPGGSFCLVPGKSVLAAKSRPRGPKEGSRGSKRASRAGGARRGPGAAQERHFFSSL